MPKCLTDCVPAVCKRFFSEDDEPPKWKGYMVIIGGILVHFSLGTVYTSGNMAPYVISYLRQNSDVTPNIRLKDSVWLTAICIASQGFGMFLGGWMFQRFGTRIATLVGSWGMSAGVALTYFTIGHSYWLTLLTYAAMFGFGMGMAYTPPFTCAMQWLPARRGLVAGLVLAGFGGGTFIVNQVQTAFMNPDNLKPDLPLEEGSDEIYFSQPSVLNRMPYCFLMLGGWYAAMQFIGVLLLFPPPKSKKPKMMLEVKSHVALDVKAKEAEEDEMPEANKTDEKLMLKAEDEEEILEETAFDEDDDTTEKRAVFQSLLDNGGKGDAPDIVNNVKDDKAVSEKEVMIVEDKRFADTEEKDFSILQMIKTRNFWILWGTFLFMGQTLNFIVPIYKIFGLTFIQDDRFLAIAGAVSALSNAAGRPVWGYLGDKLSYKKTMIIVCGTVTCILLTFETTKFGGKPMYIIWLCLYFFCFAGIFPLLPAATAKTYGANRVGVNYSIVFTGMIVASLIGGMLPTLLKDAIGYFGLFMLTSALSFSALILNLFFDGGPDDPFFRFFRMIFRIKNEKKPIDDNTDLTNNVDV